MQYTVIDPDMFDFDGNGKVCEALPSQPYYYDRINKIKLYCLDTFSMLPQICLLIYSRDIKEMVNYLCLSL